MERPNPRSWADLNGASQHTWLRSLCCAVTDKGQAADATLPAELINVVAQGELGPGGEAGEEKRPANAEGGARAAAAGLPPACPAAPERPERATVCPPVKVSAEAQAVWLTGKRIIQRPVVPWKLREEGVSMTKW